MGRDLEAELRNFDGTWPACWRPEEGETLIGVVKLYSTGQSQYGEVRTVIVEREDGSRVSVWLSSTVLLACFQREKPKVGDRIGLRYLGKHPEKSTGAGIWSSIAAKKSRSSRRWAASRTSWPSPDMQLTAPPH